MAELTAAMISHSMVFDMKVTDNSAAYLDSWIGVLKQEPKFIVSVMADVNKASDLILDQVDKDKQRLALNEQPYLTKNDPFAPLDEGEEVPFKNAAIVKTRNGDYAIRASYDGVELGLKKVSKDTAKTYFQLTDYKDPCFLRWCGTGFEEGIERYSQNLFPADGLQGQGCLPEHDSAQDLRTGESQPQTHAGCWCQVKHLILCRTFNSINHD